MHLPARYLGETTESVLTNASSSPELDGNGHTVLLVDDKASVRLFVRENLDDLGCAVLVAIEAELASGPRQ